MLADMVRIGSHQLRAVAGDSPGGLWVKVVARIHKTLIWERTRQVQRLLRHQLRDYFPGARGRIRGPRRPGHPRTAGQGTGPARAARLTRAQVSGALKRARRRGIPDKAAAIPAGRCAPCSQACRRLSPAAYAATAWSPIAVITVLDQQVKTLEKEVEAVFGRHPDAEIYLSQPGLGHTSRRLPSGRVRR